MRMTSIILGAAIVVAGSSWVWAGGTSPAPKVTAATLAVDKTKILADTGTLSKDKSALVAQQKVMQLDMDARQAARQKMADNNVTIASLEKSLSAALKIHDFTNATKIQLQLNGVRSTNAKLQADVVARNSSIKSDQAAINTLNQKINLDNRLLNIDTDHYNADQYYQTIGRP